MSKSYQIAEGGENPFRGLTKGQKAVMAAGILLTLAAVAAFIWVIVAAARDGSAGGILLASSFLLCAVGMLFFNLTRNSSPRRAWLVLYTTVPLAVAAFIISLYV